MAVNEAWKRFALANGGQEQGSGIGVNYLAVCEGASQGGDRQPALEMRDGLRRLLEGEGKTFTLEYSCDSTVEQRWFAARATYFRHRGQPYVVVMHQDITARKRADVALREAEATLRQILEAIPVGLWTLNKQGDIVYGNAAGVNIWGGLSYVGPQQFDKYKGWWLRDGRPIEADEWPAARAIRCGKAAINDEIRIRCFDGTYKTILHSAIPLRDAAGSINGAIVVNQDISSHKQVESELREANAAIAAINVELEEVVAREQRVARTDELTGVSNRRHFFELGGHLFAVAQRYRTPLSIFLFDVDLFKRVNDDFGHQTGDEILQHVAATARKYTRKADVLARYGGEEFIVMLPNTAAAEAFAVVENVRHDIAALGELVRGRPVKVTISAGVTETGGRSDTLERLIQRADSALYEAKRAGRNCTRVVLPE